MRYISLPAAVVLCGLYSSLSLYSCCLPNQAFADGWNPATRAPNRGSIINTRHNLTMSFLADIAGNGAIMDNARNNYVEVCVYCHTPHGVPSGNGTSFTFNPSFLRVNNGVVGNHNGVSGVVSNNGSALCLTCHAK